MDILSYISMCNFRFFYLKREFFVYIFLQIIYKFNYLMNI